MAFTIDRYLNVRQAYWPSLAADGRRIAFLANITDMPQVWGASLESEAALVAWPEQLTFGTDRVMGVWCSPVAGDRRLIFTRDVGGNENAQMYLLDPGTGEERSLTEGYEQAMHLFGEWSADGTRIMFAANRRHPTFFDLYVQPLDGHAQMVWQHDQPGALARQRCAPDGRHAVVTRTSSGARHDLFEIDLASGTARRITPGGEDARFNDVCYTPDGRALYLTTDLGSDFLYVARLDLVTLKLTPVLTVDWDIEEIDLSPDGRALAYVVNEDGNCTLHMLDLESGSRRSAPQLGSAPGVVGYYDERIAFSDDGRYLAFSYTSATRTSDVYLWDLADDTLRQITRSSHGGLPLDSFAAPELIHYPAFDERQIPAWFYKPRLAPETRLPVVVVVHGGPESQFVPYFHFLVQYFLHHGYAVLAPNVRGSTGYGKTYSHLDDVRRRMDSVADLAHAAHWLRAQPEIDPQRIAVYGGSYGGFMVLAALTTYPDLWAAGVDLVGPSNFVTFLENTSGYRRAHREAEYGSLEHDREFLESIAPINHLDQIRAPLMVLHGANDPRVPLSEAEQVVARLRERDVPVEFLVFDDEGHGIVKLKNKLAAYPAIVRFLDRHLRAGRA
ncbi:MAG TPA: S9 family peptidase [Herpetosiphonaceae bacterium]